MPTYILNKYQIPKFKVDPKQYNVLIRITSPEGEFLPLENPDIYHEIMELEFFDFPDDSSGLYVFNEVILEKVLGFFERNKFCDNMVIHCDQGMSRSAGVAVGWCLYKDENASIYKIYHDDKHIPNDLIVKMFSEKLKKSMKYIEKWKKERSEKAHKPKIDLLQPSEEPPEDLSSI